MDRAVEEDRLAVRRAAAAVVAWVVFAGAWVFVLRRPGNQLLSVDLLVLPVSFVLVTLVTTLWVRHNRALYQRKGPRRGLPVDAGLPRHDRLGRPLHLDADLLRTAQELVVETGDAGKTYRPAT